MELISAVYVRERDNGLVIGVRRRSVCDEAGVAVRVQSLCTDLMGVTGMRSEITTDIEKMVKAIKEVSDTPVAVGFGISTPAQAADMAGKSDGAIVGSAIVKKIAEHGENAAPVIYEYVKSMVDAVKAL